MSSRAEMSALATALSDLVERVGQVTTELTAAERDRVGQDLYEVERSLVAAGRRLSRTLDAWPQ